ncbi:MAG: hypothetical protein LBH00_03440 [Planctomycetaceae bacterium]|nr:hypothetical protein [Planctomycetaceae bacterium]
MRFVPRGQVIIAEIGTVYTLLIALIHLRGYPVWDEWLLRGFGFMTVVHIAVWLLSYLIYANALEYKFLKTTASANDTDEKQS